MHASFFRLPLAAGLTLFCSGSFAQQLPAAPRVRPAAAPPLTGRVTDAATGEGLPGSTVLFDDLKQGAATGADGSFRFGNLPRGRFTVQVR